MAQQNEFMKIELEKLDISINELELKLIDINDDKKLIVINKLLDEKKTKREKLYNDILNSITKNVSEVKITNNLESKKSNNIALLNFIGDNKIKFTEEIYSKVIEELKLHENDDSIASFLLALIGYKYLLNPNNFIFGLRNRDGFYSHFYDDYSKYCQINNKKQQSQKNFGIGIKKYNNDQKVESCYFSKDRFKDTLNRCKGVYCLHDFIVFTKNFFVNYYLARYFEKGDVYESEVIKISDENKKQYIEKTLKEFYREKDEIFYQEQLNFIVDLKKNYNNQKL